ncbi:hypothetical protein [Deinococcus arcticus]|uniref:hypothetical protein n=1 Tax=Deinococcus arcticus TaxID=2136176 RepID=UPI0018EC2D14|nr:hypothetical protein [Deinococcus arcticus]
MNAVALDLVQLRLFHPLEGHLRDVRVVLAVIVKSPHYIHGLADVPFTVDKPQHVDAAAFLRLMPVCD